MTNLPLALRCIGIVLAMMAVACGPVVEGSPTAAAEARTSTSMPVDLLAGVPGDCRLLQPGEGADGRVARQVLAGLKISADPGPLVAVDASSTLAVVASTMYTGDGDQGQTTVWTVDTDTLTVLAANAAAAEVSGFDVQLVDTAGAGPVPSAIASATDCSYAAADRLRPDPPEPTPQMRPDLLVLEPAEAAPGTVVAMQFPQHTSRGVAFQLDALVDGGWVPQYWMTAVQEGQPRPAVRVGTQGYGTDDVGVGGPGPDRVLLPEDVPPGQYRICTANAAKDFCATLQITG